MLDTAGERLFLRQKIKDHYDQGQLSFFFLIVAIFGQKISFDQHLKKAERFSAVVWYSAYHLAHLLSRDLSSSHHFLQIPWVEDSAQKSPFSAHYWGDILHQSFQRYRATFPSFWELWGRFPPRESWYLARRFFLSRAKIGHSHWVRVRFFSVLPWYLEKERWFSYWFPQDYVVWDQERVFDRILSQLWLTSVALISVLFLENF